MVKYMDVCNWTIVRKRDIKNEYFIDCTILQCIFIALQRKYRQYSHMYNAK